MLADINSGKFELGENDLGCYLFNVILFYVNQENVLTPVIYCNLMYHKNIKICKTSFFLYFLIPAIKKI